MKKLYFSIMVVFAMSIQAQTVDFEDLNLSTPQSYWNGSDETGNFTSGILEFQNSYYTPWAYWEAGFAYTNQVSDTMTGTNGQYSSFADGGYNSSNYYIIGQDNAVIYVNNGSSGRGIQSLQISNTNYAAHSMEDGDSFAKKFGGVSGDDPDWFLLTINGYKDGTIEETHEFYLADFRFSDNNQDYIIKNWTQVDLNWNPTDSIVFSLSSSDNSGGWMNTPSFFALDNIVVDPAASIEEEMFNHKVFPNPAKDFIKIETNQTTENLQVSIINLQGQIIEKILIKNSEQQINIADLQIGFYQLVIESTQGKTVKSFQKI